MKPSRSNPHRRPRARASAALPLLAALLLLALAPLTASAQQADAVLRNFKLTGDWILEVDGEEKPGADVYMADQVPAMLVVANALPSPTILLPREQAVRTVSFMKVVTKDNGFADVLADAELTPAGAFQMRGQSVAFTVDGKQALLKPRPPLLGEQALSDMMDYSPAYRRSADSYDPDSGALRALEDVDEPVRVRVYFGSWCGFCKQYVPRLLKVAEELQGSGVDFEFYGLPQGFGDEPMAKRDDVSGVPTGIVYRDGREVGRLEAADWQAPEVVLQRLASES